MHSLCPLPRCFGSGWVGLNRESFLLQSGGQGAESRCAVVRPCRPHALLCQTGLIAVLHLVMGHLLSSETTWVVRAGRGDLGVHPGWRVGAWLFVSSGCLGSRARPRPGPVTAASGSFGFVCFW